LGNSGIAFKENERLGGNAGTMISEFDNWITASLKPIRGNRSCHVQPTEATNAAFEEIEEIAIPKPPSEKGK
jgi:hypothetical protein